MRCVAVGCKTGRKSGLRIHSFPRDTKRRLEWAVKVNIAENGKLWVPPKDCCYGVCEAHFEEDQYEPRRMDRKLKPYAIPTLFTHRKVPKRRRMLVRGSPAGRNSDATVEAAANTCTASVTATGATSAMTVVAGALTSTGLSAMAISQQAGLCSADTNSVDAASRVHRMHAVQSSTTSLVAGDVAEPAFSVATSGGNIILVPATTISHNQSLIIGRPSLVMHARTATGPATFRLTAPNGSRAVNPNAFTSVPASQPATSPAQPQSLVLPPLGCLPNAGPIIMVPMSQPSVVTAVPRAGPEQSPAATAVHSVAPGQGASPLMPVILSVESLSGKAPIATSGVVGPPPLIARPPTYDELRREVMTLKQESADLRRDVGEAARQAARVKAALSRQSERLTRFLRIDQVERLIKLPGDAPLRWTEPTLRFALDIYRCSPKAYCTLLEAHYPLPSESTLRTFCVEYGVRDGVPPELQAEPQGEDGVNIVWL